MPIEIKCITHDNLVELAKKILYEKGYTRNFIRCEYRFEVNKDLYYIIDVAAINKDGNVDIAIECGNVAADKVETLKRFIPIVIHLPYGLPQESEYTSEYLLNENIKLRGLFDNLYSLVNTAKANGSTASEELRKAYGTMVKRVVSFRMDSQLLDEFDRLSGTRTSNLEDAMRMWIQVCNGEGGGGNTSITAKPSEGIEVLQNEIRLKDEIIRGKEAHIADLQVQVGLLTKLALPPHEEVKKKHWWQRQKKM